MSKLKHIVPIAAAMALCLEGKATDISPQSETVQVRYVSTENGLSNPTVNDIYIDESGLMWIATGDGLNRYDGISTEKMDAPFNNIRSVCGDDNGHLFMSGRHTLVSYDMAHGRYTTVCNDDISALFYSDDLYWSTPSGIYRYDNGRGELYFDLGGGSACITDFCIGDDGVLSVLLDNDELLRIDGDISTSFPTIPNCYSLSPGIGGEVWVNSRTDGTLRVGPDGRTAQFKVEGGKMSDYNNVREVICRDHGTIYVGSYAGLSRLDTTLNCLTPVIYKTSLASFDNRAVRTMYTRKGVVVLGTYHAGIHYFRTNADMLRPVKITSPVVSSIVEDHGGVIWTGTVGGGLVISDDKNPVPSRLKDEVAGNVHLKNIKSLYLDPSDGAIWITLFSEGIYRIDGSRTRLEHLRSLSSKENITRIQRYDSQRLLANSLEGLFFIDGDATACGPVLKTPVQEDIILDFCIDSDGSTWISTANAIYNIPSLDNPSNFKRYPYSTISGLRRENTVTGIVKDRHDRIWFSSDGCGIFRYDRGSNSFVNYSSDRGLKNGCVNDIYAGTDSTKLLISTNDGLASFDIDEEHFRNYSGSEGFPFSIVSRSFISADSLVYICDAKGVNTIRLDELDVKPAGYSYFVKNIYVGGQKLTPSENGPMYRSPLFQNEIVLTGLKNCISFEISNDSLDPALSGAFEYMLDGLDSDYMPALGNMVTYTNLKQGNYELHIRSAMNENAPAYCFKLKIVPDFFHSRLFLILLIVLILGCAAFVIVAYSNSARLKMMLQMEKHDTAFMTNISHDFRTPLALISVGLESLMKEKGLSSQATKKIEGAWRNTCILNGMVDDFIDYNRSGIDNWRAVAKPARVADILEKIRDRFAEYAQEKNISFRLDISPEASGAVAELDVKQFSRALVNLVSNAFKYTKANVLVRLSADGKTAVVKIEDDGIGIRPENISHIFERFYREEEANSVTEIKGSGIGLPLAKKIIEMHGGSISVGSVPGSGTSFSIRIPLTDRQADPTAQDYPVDLPSDPGPSGTPGQDMVYAGAGRPSILIVEDNGEMAELIAGIFNSEFDVLFASDGKTGLEKAVKSQPDIVLSDVMMPGMSGLELSTAIKGRIETSHIPVVLITALGADSNVVEGLEKGADDYVTKPFRASILKAKVSSILRNREALKAKYTHDASADEDILVPPGIDADILKKAGRVIEEHINDGDFDIQKFASEMCMSKTLLFNKIKSLTGLSPNAFITSLKLKKSAAEIKTHPEETTASIAYRCGFETPSYYIKCFKKFYGMTPLAYRKRCREEDPSC